MDVNNLTVDPLSECMMFFERVSVLASEVYLPLINSNNIKKLKTNKDAE